MGDLERRFLTGFRQVDSDRAGLVQEDDGGVWVVDPDGTRTQLPGSGGTGCVYLECESDSAVLVTKQVFIAGRQESGADDVQTYAAAEDDNGVTRSVAQMDLSANGDSSMLVGTRNVDGVQGSQLEFSFDQEFDTLTASLIVEHPQVETSAGFVVEARGADLFAALTLFADHIHFAGGPAIERPTFDLSSGTLPQLAQALADLGLITVVA